MPRNMYVQEEYCRNAVRACVDISLLPFTGAFRYAANIYVTL